MTPAAGTLPCGRDADALLEQVADGRGAERDGHQRDCPHCGATLGEYDRAWGPVRELAAEPVVVPDSVAGAALGWVRGRAAHPDHVRVDDPDGVTRIAARVVLAAARHAAQRVPGVRVALSGALPGVVGPGTAVLITLAVDYGSDLRILDDDVRRAVTAAVRDLTGLAPARVDVVVDDVLPA